MNKVVPVLPIDDEASARAFYVDKLGFEVDFAMRFEPDFPVYMGVERGELYLHLSEHAKGQPGVEVYIFVDDLASWHARLQDRDVAIEVGPVKQPWGNTDMVVKDPFGSTLRFSQLNTH
ncbi:MAG: VOC family protein [Polyangiaceae bacterium]